MKTDFTWWRLSRFSFPFFGEKKFLFLQLFYLFVQSHCLFGSALSWIVTGLLTGLVIDSGDGVTHVVNYSRNQFNFIFRFLKWLLPFYFFFSSSFPWLDWWLPCLSLAYDMITLYHGALWTEFILFNLAFEFLWGNFITSQFQLFALIFPFAKVINIPVILNDKLVSFSFLLKKKKKEHSTSVK